MVSGSTALTVALVPTATNAGVRISPCGVWMTPLRPRAPGMSASTVKNERSVTFQRASLGDEVGPRRGAAGFLAAGFLGTVPIALSRSVSESSR